MRLATPNTINSYRDTTQRHAKMAGVTTHRFTCRCCGQVKPTAGRKRLSKHIADGYKCADCAQEGAEA